MKMQQNYGSPVKATGTGSTSAVATISAVASTQYFITDISGSSDLSTATILVKDGTTVIWQDIVGAASYNRSFQVPLTCTTGNSASVTVTGTSNCKANISGYSNP